MFLFKNLKFTISIYSIYKSFLQALIGDNFSTRETVVHENGKVMPDCDEYKEYLHIPLDYYEIKQNRPLRLKKKLYEFYTAPITKFWANAVSIQIIFYYK